MTALHKVIKGRKFKTLCGLFLIALFINYYACSTLFFHTHYTRYGIIVHSHPYKGAHTHTSAQYETIAILTNLLFCTTFIFWKCFITKITRIIQFSLHLIHSTKLSQFIFLRAPPISICERTS